MKHEDKNLMKLFVTRRKMFYSPSFFHLPFFYAVSIGRIELGIRIASNPATLIILDGN